MDFSPKVLIIDLSNHYGGSSSRVLSLMARAKTGSVALAGLKSGAITIQAIQLGLPVHALADHKADARILPRLIRLIREEGYNILDSQNIQSKFWANLAAIITKTSLVSTINSWYASEHGEFSTRVKLYTLLELSTNQSLDLYITVSEKDRRSLIKSGLPDDAIELIYNALELARAKSAVFLLASTSEVYGDPLVSPQSETYWGHVNPVGPRGVYDEAKRFAEAMTMAYHRYHGVETRIARIFNTYGPRMRPHDGRVVSNFLIQALAGRPLTVYGDGRQTRSFCFVSDLVDGLFRLLLSAEVEPVNLGNPAERTIRDLVAAIGTILGRPLEVTYNPLPQDDPRVRQPDITKARECLGWEPKVDLEAGLRETLAYFRKKGVGA